MAKRCIFLDYDVAVYVEKIHSCDSLLDPETLKAFSERNYRMAAVDGPKRIVLTGSYLLHVIFDADCIPSGCVRLDISRSVECGNGCDPMYYSTPVAFCGSGMLLPAGEYSIAMNDQCAHGAMESNLGQSYPLTLLFEPFSQDMLDAARFNYAGVR